ncbi:MAG: hypothetical protein KDI63_02975 [Gammaproteobacteria bacterium]|nr:hypothetical protein [Gammaproteobacteria bacterium]
MTRFMAPRYFDREQLQAVETLLEHLEIGDDEGRRIFIIALEYELAEYDNTSQNNNPPPPLPSPPENFQRVASAAEELCRALQSLPEDEGATVLHTLTGSDPFQRIYNTDYLNALQRHAERLADACRAARPVKLTPAAPLSENQAQFINILAEAYWECFETQPNVDGLQPFAALVNGIIDICQLGIELDHPQLELLLSGRNATGT